MKKWISLSMVAIGFMLAAMQNAAVLTFEKDTVYNFGQVQQGKAVSHVFKFINEGREPLIITSVEPTCGCTIADYTKTPVKPSEVGQITLTFNAASTLQPFNKSILVKSNSTTPIRRLYIKGEVVK